MLSREIVVHAANAILAAREFCGNEREAIADTLADNGISIKSQAGQKIATLAMIEADDVWSVNQADAGVTNPITEVERGNIERGLK